jgi:hypothetical protein
VKISLAKKPFKHLYALFRTWKARQRFIAERIAYLSAVFVRDYAQSRLKGLPKLKAYRDSLTLVEASPAGYAGKVFGVYAKGAKKTFTKRESPYVLLYVRPKKRVPITDPSVEILARFSPWTWDTIPKLPPKSQAVLITREVTKDEAAEWTAKRLRSKRAWEAAFVEAGVPVRAPRVQVTTAAAQEDTAFQALRVELGAGGSDWVPHWRPALRLLRTQGLRDILRDPLLQKAMRDPMFKPEDASPRAQPVSGKALAHIRDFQQGLGY